MTQTQTQVKSTLLPSRRYLKLHQVHVQRHQIHKIRKERINRDFTKGKSTGILPGVLSWIVRMSSHCEVEITTQMVANTSILKIETT